METPDVYGQLYRDYTVVVNYDYDDLRRLVGADYSTGIVCGYGHDEAGNRTILTETTPSSGTVVTVYGYDRANRLETRAVSDGRSYTYAWSDRGELLAETTQGVDVRTFDRHRSQGSFARSAKLQAVAKQRPFTYTGDGTRVALAVAGHGVTRYVVDRGGRILALTPTPGGFAATPFPSPARGRGEGGRGDGERASGPGYVRQATDEDAVDANARLISTFRTDPLVQTKGRGPSSFWTTVAPAATLCPLICTNGHFMAPTPPPPGPQPARKCSRAAILWLRARSIYGVGNPLEPNPRCPQRRLQVAQRRLQAGLDLFLRAAGQR